ncbi:Hypothetical protein CRIB_1036 [Romboutsia ilealis]|uniref:Uncharacterized protein n=1 Tax=Romboutsia ilealis TaxID=1115758 RepID=A0A1V1I0Y2_9FIRM|nr:hypothetical protein [Romboutsia ilealis]CED93787.1 Hypothetical protein CRIB_1036 [Romboutsia ilealis]
MYSILFNFRLHVADMEDGNTSLSSSGVNAKTVYEKELDDNSTKAYTQVSLITGVLSLVSYFILKFKTYSTKNSI